MLQVLFTMLKILGILILTILGIILTVLLLVLFVPIRYSGDASFEGKPKGNVLVSWLLRLVTVRVNYDGKALKALVKVLWFKLFEQTLWPSQDAVETMDEMAEDLSDAGLFVGIPEQDIVQVNEVRSEPANELVKDVEAQPLPKPVAEVKAKSSSEPVTDVNAKSIQKPAPQVNTPSVRAIEKAQTQKKAEKTTDTAVPDTEKPPLLEKIYHKVQSLILSVVEKMKAAYRSVNEKYAVYQEKLETVRTFLGDPENQKTLRLIKRQLWKLIRHILPRKMRGRIRFGFDDPAVTGQILTYISPFYGLYAKSVTVEPVFDEKVIEGELHIKGRIRVGTLLWYVVRVLLNKNFRTILKKFLNSRK